MRALIIDDSLAVRKIIKGILIKDLGFEAVTDAENGQLGLDELVKSNFSYDVIILDWHMPVMDGIETLMYIREQNKLIPVIICTSAGDKESIINAITAGANEYLFKPFDASGLESKVNKVISNYQQQLKNISNNSVLIADDLPLARVTIRKIIEKDQSFDTIVEASDGAEALKLFKSQQFNLVILDWRMPKLNGIETLKEMRSINPTVPIIMVTGKSTHEHMVEAFDAGASNFLPKPFTKDQLLNSLHLSMVTSEPQPNNKEDKDDGFDLDIAIDSESSTSEVPIDNTAFDHFFNKQWTTCIEANTSFSLICIAIDTFDVYKTGCSLEQFNQTVSSIQNSAYTVFGESRTSFKRSQENLFAISTIGDSYGELQLKIQQLLVTVEKCAIPHPGKNEGSPLTVSIGAQFGVPRSENGLSQFKESAQTHLLLAQSHTSGGFKINRTL
ncbi:MAG: response regulator [Fibrobacterales bacterium]